MIINELMLRRKAPAVFATEPEDGRTSDRYSFLPTTDIIELLQEDGWEAWSASQVNSRTWSKGHAKHVVRMRRQDWDDGNFGVGDSFPEMLIMNAHNGLGGYHLQGGLFRLVCSNGMVISEQDFGKIYLKHRGFEPEQVFDASRKLIATTSTISDKIDSWTKIELDKDIRKQYVVDAAKLRFEEPDDSILQNLSLPRRKEDDKKDLWRLHNVVQENLMQGGFLNQTTRRRVRPITSIQKDLDLNSDLWALTSEYAESVA